MRRAWRMLATLCAEAGYPTLRFDPPGCGDSLGELSDLDGVEVFVEAAIVAADELRRQASVERIVLAGHGLGAVIATLAAPQVGAEALAALAPPSSGRAHLREVALWGRVVAEGLGLASHDHEGEAAGGFQLPAELKASIAAIDLRELEEPPAQAIFVASPPRTLAAAELAELWRAQGADLTLATYDEHSAALDAPTNARPPLALFDAFAEWLLTAAPTARRRWYLSSEPASPAWQHDETFSESLVRFGPEDRLAGVLCAPAGARTGATVLLLNAGGDPHTGWARSTVEHARNLAERGVASLRMDLSDLGDSDGLPSGTAPAVREPRHVEDALSAISWLETRGLGPVLLAGRCSGADVAYSAAVLDPRIRDLVLINQSHFTADLGGLADRPQSRLTYYLDRSRDPTVLLQRCMRGEIDLRAACSRLGRAACGLGLALLGHDRHSRAIRMASRTLTGRGVELTFLYAARDPAYAEFQTVFGPDGRKLRGARGVELIRVEGADNTLTEPASRAILLEVLARRALAAEAPSPAPKARPRKPPPARDQVADGAMG